MSVQRYEEKMIYGYFFRKNSLFEMLIVLQRAPRSTPTKTMLDKQIKAGLTDMDLLILSAYWDEGLELRAQQLRRQNNSVTWLPIREGVNPS